MQTKSWLIGCPNGHYSIHIALIGKTFELLVDGPDRAVATANNLIQYIDKEFAYSQGELFARNLTDAVEAGYHLSGNYFFHEDGRKIHYSNALDTDRTQESFIQLLSTGELA